MVKLLRPRQVEKAKQETVCLNQRGDYRQFCCGLCSGGQLLECRQINHEGLMIQGTCLNRLFYCFSLSIRIYHLRWQIAQSDLQNHPGGK